MICESLSEMSVLSSQLCLLRFEMFSISATDANDIRYVELFEGWNSELNGEIESYLPIQNATATCMCKVRSKIKYVNPIIL